MLNYPANDLERILLSEEEIKVRVESLAKQISKDYTDTPNLYLVGILKGAFIFLADLARHITVPHKVDFMALSSYGATTESTGEVRIILDLRQPVERMHILIVEDIIDTGNTVHYLQRLLKGRQPASLKTCALIKKQRNSIEVPVDYLGFTIPNVWVVGYGLDYADTYRTLPYIAELKKEIYQPR
ncbi:MAG: hypoxanthine phosphoribosyltransferase [Chloroflexi bacterium RBG_16_48_8]|nr:MAG: hypoxanthine phosphoribosyltransferase [Chloroflexi bacterium RBG_16_48_8]